MREPIWMETETAHMNETQFISYAAHDHDPNCADICRSSKHVPSLQIIVYGRLCTKARAHTPSHMQEGTCAQALKSFEDLHSVHESRDNSSKHKNVCRCKPFTAASIAFVRTRNKKRRNIVHGAECFLGAPLPEILPSLARFGAPLPHAQHI
jgi:hypothetical protein